MDTKSLDSRIDFRMWLGGMAQQFQGILAGTLTAEQKLDLILKEMENDVLAKRLTAREVRTQWAALKDPETDALEPLERLEAKRAKLVQLGGELENKKATASERQLKTFTIQQGQLAQEIAALDKVIGPQTDTWNMLGNAYEEALATYKQALAAYETARSQGPAMLAAIKAYQEAVETRDAVRKQANTKANTAFLDDLAGELNNAQAQLRSDDAIEDDLDATSTPSANDLLAEHDAHEVNEAVFAEFKAAAGKKAKARA